jgi:hypothetical protein
MNKIIFHSSKAYNNKTNAILPEPTAKVMPQWFNSMDLFFKDPRTEKDFVDQLGNKYPTFKACPALLDIFTTGYVLRTPCDLTFFEKDGRIEVATEPGYEDFSASRPEMPIFPVPHGHAAEHFHWWANWSVGLPEGYSGIYVSPLNHFDLPFTTVSGIIDNDKVHSAGLIPFFLKEGFTGVIPKGTPFLQVIPFKREDWEMEVKHYSAKEIDSMFRKVAEIFRKPEGGVYKKSFWSRRKYR